MISWIWKARESIKINAFKRAFIIKANLTKNALILG